MKKFSIIIPTLNEALHIKQCLNNLQIQRDKAEIIVVDGGSTDNTVEIATPLADKVITSEKGRAIQMNLGAKLSLGKTLIFLHADTTLPDNALKIIEQSQAQWGRFDITLQGRSSILIIIACFMNWRSRLTGIATGDQVIFVNKALFFKIKGYPEISLMEDISLCSALKVISKPDCLKTKVISSGRRWEQFGMLKTILLMWTLRLRFFFGEDSKTLSDLYYKGLFWKT